MLVYEELLYRIKMFNYKPGLGNKTCSTTHWPIQSCFRKHSHVTDDAYAMNCKVIFGLVGFIIWRQNNNWYAFLSFNEDVPVFNRHMYKLEGVAKKNNGCMSWCLTN